MPPVFGPVSPSPTRLWSCAEASASAVSYTHLRGLGLDPDASAKSRRAALRPCLDWSERRPHLAGHLAAALACQCFEMDWVRRRKDSRAVILTEEGRAVLEATLPGFRCDAPEPVSPALREPVPALA